MVVAKAINAHAAKMLAEFLRPIIPATAITFRVVGEELGEVWNIPGMSLEEGAKQTKGRLLQLQRDHHAEQMQQRTLLTILGQQAAAAGSFARNTRLPEYFPSLPPPPAAGQGGSKPGSRQGSPGRLHNVCDSWRKTQSCPRGAACRFAASHS